MQVRREDREFIDSLKPFGAGLGAILAIVLVLNAHRTANDRLAQEQEYIQENAPLLILAASDPTSNRPVGSEASVGEFVHTVNKTKAQFGQLHRGFWTTLPRSGLVGICLGAGVVGVVAGYAGVWLLSWIATVVMIWFVRSLYRIVWLVNPDFDGGSQQLEDARESWTQRDENRILPGAIKLSVMGFVLLVLLAISVYFLTR